MTITQLRLSDRKRIRNPRTGTVHISRPIGPGHALTHCGLPWVDLFATYEYGTMWPSVDEPITCAICIVTPSGRME